MEPALSRDRRGEQHDIAERGQALDEPLGVLRLEQVRDLQADREIESAFCSSGSCKSAARNSPGVTSSLERSTQGPS